MSDSEGRDESREGEDYASDSGVDPRGDSESESGQADDSAAPQSGDDESEHSSDDSEPGHGLLDLEALESDDDYSNTDSHPYLDDDYDGAYSSVGSFHSSFPQFMRLPPELRERIWRLFCPFVDASHRVFELRLEDDSYRPALVVNPGVKLLVQMEPAAALLAVHHESRAVALRAMPDTLLSCSSGELIRFNKEKDIVLLNHEGVLCGSSATLPRALTPIGAWSRELSNQIQNLGFTSRFVDGGVSEDEAQYERAQNIQHDLRVIMSFLTTFPRIKVFYFSLECTAHPRRFLSWCGSEFVNSYHFVHAEENEYGLESEVEHAYIWPNAVQHLDFARSEVSRLGSASAIVPGWVKSYSASQWDSFPGPSVHNGAPREQLRSVEIWPIVHFAGARGQKRLEILRTTKTEDLSDTSESESRDSDAGSALDDDFYDAADGFIDDDDDDDDDDDNEEDEPDDGLGDFDDKDGLDDALSPGQLGSEGSDHDFNGFSPIEPNYPTVIDSDSRPEEEQARTRPAKRRRVVLSDDEDAEGSASGDGGEDQESTSHRPAKIRRRNVVDSDEGGDDDEAGPSTLTGPDSSSTEKGDTDDSESDSESDSDSNDGGQSQGRMTLAERLQIHRQDNPVAGDGQDSEDEGDSMGGDGSESSEDGGRDYGESVDDDRDDDDGGDDDDGDDDDDEDEW